MLCVAFGPRARRVFWTLLVATASALSWLWDRTTDAPLVSGRWTVALDTLAVVAATVGLLLLARMAWKLSGRTAKGGGS